jgi:hypothetical protein
VNNFNASCTTLQRCRQTNANFQRFLEEAEKEEAMKGLNFEAYLIMPVQRIPRYVLLLQDLLNTTDKTHPDYNNIESALTRVKNFADYINKSKKNSENREQLRMIRERVRQCDFLYNDGLQYIKDDFIKVKMKKKLRDVHIYLFDSSLLITKESKKRKEKLKDSIEIPLCVLPLPTTGITGNVTLLLSYHVLKCYSHISLSFSLLTYLHITFDMNFFLFETI